VGSAVLAVSVPDLKGTVLEPSSRAPDGFANAKPVEVVEVAHHLEMVAGRNDKS
jgi:hypothetical protein